MTAIKRCEWCGDDPLYQQYHDEEWGVPVYDDQRLFEMLVLQTILRKREGYRKAFKNFDPAAVARMKASSVDRLVKNPDIVRNRKKIESTLSNARCFLEIQAEYGSFSDWLWAFVDGKPIQNRFECLTDIPASTPLSDELTKALKKKGFKFVGTTICYAYMQAVGMVNDHVVSCDFYRG